MTYEERVKQRAEEFAACWEVAHISNKDPEYFSVIIEEFITLARLSVQREAEAYRKCWWSFKTVYEAGARHSMEKRLEEELQSIGLVPPKKDNDGK